MTRRGDTLRLWRWGVLVAVGALTLVAGGCSTDEESSGPPNYFPFTTGSWWAYVGTELDTAGNEVPDRRWRDSLVIVGQTEVEGKRAAVIVTYTDGSPADTIMAATEGGRLYYYFGGQSLQRLPFPTPRGWVMFADPNAAEWTAWDTTVTGFPVRLPGLPQEVAISGRFEWKGQRGGTTTVTVKGRSVTAQEFVTTISFSGDLFFGVLRAGTASFRFPIRLWAADGIGIVRRQEDPPVAVITSNLLPGGQQRFSFSGQRRVLVDYSLQQ
ncbi:MAG: hypothetical protein ABDH31_07530 [Chlorobiota bacterium]